jgi:hypothetical protein
MNIERILLWGLTAVVLGMAFLISYLGDVHADAMDANNLEIASLHLKIAELEGELLQPPEQIEMAVDYTNGDAVVRIGGLHLYAFPGVCHSPPGYNGNL